MPNHPIYCWVKLSELGLAKVKEKVPSYGLDEIMVFIGPCSYCRMNFQIYGKILSVHWLR